MNSGVPFASPRRLVAVRRTAAQMRNSTDRLSLRLQKVRQCQRQRWLYIKQHLAQGLIEENPFSILAILSQVTPIDVKHKEIKMHAHHNNISNILVYWAPVGQAFGAIIQLIITIYIAAIVQIYARRRDFLDFMYRRWNEQQQLNISDLQSPGDLMILEKMVYGSSFLDDTEEIKKRIHIFIYLNMVQHYYVAQQAKILTRRQCENYAMATLVLICREKDEISYLLTRGYTEDFRIFVMSLLEKTRPIEPRAKPSTRTALQQAFDRLRQHKGRWG